MLDSRKSLDKAYAYQNTSELDGYALKRQIKEKSVIPYQVEFQPPPASLRKICWLECEYCYGASADDDESPRMDKETALRTLTDIALGGVKKVVFAGYATDPLNSPYISDLLERAIEHGMTFGFNTKALKVHEKITKLLKHSKVAVGSYVSLSVDAGSNDTYNVMHAVKSNAKLYERVLRNAEQLRCSNMDITLSAAYLINQTNCDPRELEKFISDFRNAGCNFIRFSFLQQPKGVTLDGLVLPDRNIQDQIKSEITDLITCEDKPNCPVKLVDIDHQENIYRKARTLPCFARFIFPTVGYDGWLYNCSQSSSPNFHSTALGDLSKHSFWELFYNYDINSEAEYFKKTSEKLIDSGCRCDRKMHLANKNLINSRQFNFQHDD